MNSDRDFFVTTILLSRHSASEDFAQDIFSIIPVYSQNCNVITCQMYNFLNEDSDSYKQFI